MTERPPLQTVRSCVKRLTDITASVLLILVLGPVFGLTALLVRYRLGAPVIFRQPRTGRHGTTFTLYKFRSMLEPPACAPETPDADRLTRFGVWLRSTSLDELPELVNVIKGDMSLVGPRPLLPRYMQHYSTDQARRHDVRPGITGLAQVRGRNAADWIDRLRWDVDYVDAGSLLLDLKILLLTVAVVVRRSGVSAPGHATVAEFTGNAAQSS